MFAIVTSGAELFLKVNESNLDRYEAIEAKRHGKMPYYQPSNSVLEEPRKKFLS